MRRRRLPTRRLDPVEGQVMPTWFYRMPREERRRLIERITRRMK